MPAGELRTDLLALAEESGVPVQDVLVSDASRRTTALNAYVSGLGATRRIVVYDTMLEELPDEQIESIVAHELGHVVNRDVLTGTLHRRARAAAADGAARVAALLDPGCCGGRGRTGPATPAWSRWCSSCWPRGACWPPRCRTPCPGRSRRGPTCTRST